MAEITPSQVRAELTSIIQGDAEYGTAAANIFPRILNYHPSAIAPDDGVTLCLILAEEDQDDAALRAQQIGFRFGIRIYVHDQNYQDGPEDAVEAVEELTRHLRRILMRPGNRHRAGVFFKVKFLSPASSYHSVPPRRFSITRVECMAHERA